MENKFLPDSNYVFWEKQAENLEWFKRWDDILEWNMPNAKWFVGGKLNASYLCVDKHIKNGLGEKIAIHWQNELGVKLDLKYIQLYEKINKLASALKQIGVKKGDVVVIYLPLIPDAVISMLAVTRIGAIHSVVFSGFSSKALQDRINDAQAKFLITTDFSLRRGKIIKLKESADLAVEQSPSIQKVLVIQREDIRNVNIPVNIFANRDVLYSELIDKIDSYIEPEMCDSNDSLFILYTSGTTGKPKGIVHSTGGYLVYAYYTLNKCFNLQKDSIYWCTADVGWITGHSYLIYAPLMHGLTTVMYEGAPDFPDQAIWWKLIAEYKVSIFYTSPTAIRMFIKWGKEFLKQHDLSSLKYLGSVGEVINPETWEWYFQNVGQSRCPIIDTWWQTETGGFMIAPTAQMQISDLKPGSATFPLDGIVADVVDETGASVSEGQKGFLVIKKPWPGMMSGIYNDSNKYKEVYWSKFKNLYFSGDWAIKDKDGYFWLLGRADEVLNVSGHRIGTAEIENATVSYKNVAEAAVVPVPDQIKGENFVIFVILKQDNIDKILEKNNIILALRMQIGPWVKPTEIYFVNALPKTRSGKILRRVLKSIVNENKVGDITTIEDSACISKIQAELKRL